MTLSRRGFFSFLAGAAVPTVIAGGIIRAGGLIKPPGLMMNYRIQADFADILVAGQAWFIVGYDAHGNMVSEQVPWREVQDGGWTSAKSFRSITGIIT